MIPYGKRIAARLRACRHNVLMWSFNCREEGADEFTARVPSTTTGDSVIAPMNWVPQVRGGDLAFETWETANLHGRGTR